jgi:MFS family permease
VKLICFDSSGIVLFPFMAFMVEDFGYTGERMVQLLLAVFCFVFIVYSMNLVQGKYVGLLGASFCGAQFFSSVYWGKFSDDYGRKPAVLVGTFGTIFGMLLFGLASSYPQAVAGRIIAGLLSGNIGVMKTYLIEITDDTNRGVGFSYMSVSWSIGSVVAPLFGGLLSNPCTKYPSIFKRGTIFDRFPYFLPCLCCVILLAFSVVICSLFMKETRVWSADSGDKNSLIKSSATSGKENKNVRDRDDASYMPLTEKSEHGGVDRDNIEMTSISPVHANGSNKNGKSSPTKSFFSVFSTAPTGSNTKSEASPQSVTNQQKYVIVDTEDDENEADEENGTASSQTDDRAPTFSDENGDNGEDRIKNENGNGRHGSGLAMKVDEETGKPHSEVIDLNDDDHSIRKNFSVVNGHLPSGSGTNGDGEEEDELFECPCCVCRSSGNMDAAASNDGDSDKNGLELTSDANKKKLSPLRRRNVVLACCNYAVLCMAYILFDETLPLYLKLSVEQGGFSFLSTDIGGLLSLPGFFMIPFAYLILPRIAKMSKKAIFRASVIICAAHIMLWPLLGKTHYMFLDEDHPTHQRFLDHFVFYPIMFVLIMIKSIAGTVAFMAVNMQIGHSVFDDDLGAVNGFGQSLAALSRGAGPAIGGLLWSFSVSLNFVYLNFIAMVSMLLLNLYLGDLLPVSLDYKKQRKQVISSDDDDVEEEINLAGEM